MMLAAGVIVGILLRSLLPVLTLYRDVVIVRHIRDLMNGCSPEDRSRLCRELVAALQVSDFRDPEPAEPPQEGAAR
ncbi:hypothetical protein ACVHNB_06705 [Streptomyces sp. YJ-C3]